MKIANKISLSFLATAIILTSAAATIFYITAKDSLEMSIKNNLFGVIASRTNYIETYLKMTELYVGQLSKSVVLENLLKIKGKENPQRGETFDVAMKRLVRTKEENPAIAELLLLDATGKVVVSSNESSVGSDESMDAFFLEGQKGTYIKDVYYSEIDKEPLIVVSTPFLDSQAGELLGVIAARVRLNDLNSITAERIGLGDSGECYIVNKSKFMITPSRFIEDTVLKQKIDSEQVRKALLHKDKKHVLPQEMLISISIDYRGVQTLGTHGFIPQMQWAVIAEIDTKEALAPLVKLRLILFIVLFFVPLLSWLLGAVIARKIVVPLQKLNKASEIIGSGNLDYKININTKDEVGQLSRAFNAMAKNLKNSVVSIQNLNKEITERKQAEEKIKEGEKKWLSLMKNTDDTIMVVNKNNVIQYVNRTIPPTTPEGVIGKTIYEYVAKEHHDVMRKSLEKVYKTGKPDSYEVTLDMTRINPKLGILWFRTKVVAIKEYTGRTSAVIMIATNITELKKMEEALLGEKNKLEKYFNATGAIIVVLSLDGKVLLINRIGCETLGHERGDILNKKWIDKFILKKDRIKTTTILDSAIREKKEEIKYFETGLLAKNRKHIIVNWGCVIIKDELGESQASLNIGINTTELSEAKIAIDQLKELNKLKDDFLNIAAHELKTPLTSIIGFSEILKKRSHSLSSEQQKYINIINGEGSRLNNIIKRILTITRFESGREIIRFEPFNLAAFIQSLRPSLDVLLRNKKARLVINIEKNDITIRSNKEKILEVIYNFVDNSLKYGSEEQTITISITHPEKGRVKVAVEDQGPGIPKEKIDQLFNKFSQLEPSFTRSEEGTGLGLYICKLIIDSLGGEIGVESTLGEGSTFYFILPIKNSTTQKRY